MTGEPPADRPRDPAEGWDSSGSGLPWWAGDAPIDIPLDLPAEPPPVAVDEQLPTDAQLAEVVAFPATSEIFPDARGGERWMRVTWHPEADCVVLSVWRSTTCIATMRVARGDVPGLVQTLVGGLVDPGVARRADPSTQPVRTDTG